MGLENVRKKRKKLRRSALKAEACYKKKLAN
jgi:hypothetical protein